MCRSNDILFHVHLVDDDVLTIPREGLFEEGERESPPLAIDKVTHSRQTRAVNLRKPLPEGIGKAELGPSLMLVSLLELIGGDIIRQWVQTPAAGIRAGRRWDGLGVPILLSNSNRGTAEHSRFNKQPIDRGIGRTTSQT